MNYVLSGIGFSVIGYIAYKYGKKIVYKYVMDQVKHELDKRMESEEGFTPMRKTNSAMVKINHGGKSHSFYVPYNRRKSVKMLQTRVYLIKGEKKENISQKPGIPYLVSAKDLGGEKIVIEDDDGNVLKTYVDNEIPDYY